VSELHELLDRGERLAQTLRAGTLGVPIQGRAKALAELRTLNDLLERIADERDPSFGRLVRQPPAERVYR